MGLVFTKSNIIFSAICAGGLLVLIAISIVPQAASKRELARALPAARAALDRQRQLQDIMTTLDKLAAKHQKSPLPVVTPKPLPFEETGRLLDDLKAMANDRGLTLRAIYPDLTHRRADWRQLDVRTELQGGLDAIRGFLIDCLGLPYVDGVEQVRIESGNSVPTLALTFVINLS